MSHQVLETPYGQLVAQLTVALAGDGKLYKSAPVLVETAVKIADEVARQSLDAMIRYQERQPKPKIEWLPEPGDELRSGQTWKVEEDKALVAEYILKHGPEQMAAFHRRSHGAVLGRLVHLGRLRFNPNQGYVDVETGMRFA